MRAFSPLTTILLLLSACGDTKIVTPEPVGSDDEVFQDVPIAKGMKYQGRGEKRKDGQLRIYRMELRGGVRLDELVKFYRETLPLHRWEFVHRKGEEPNPVTLVFAKGLEKLTLDLKNETVHETVVHIQIDYRN